MPLRDTESGKSGQQAKATGLLLGVTAVLGGVAWCFRDTTSSRRRIPVGPSLPSKKSPSSCGKDPSKSWIAGALVAGIAGVLAGSVTLRNRVPEARHRYGGDVRLAGRVIIHRPPEDVYHFWRDFTNLPQVISFIESVVPEEGNVYHWVARGPLGPAIEWDAEVVDDDPGRLLAWRTLEGSDLQTWGTVIFKPCNSNNSSTEVTVAFNFCPPANATGALARYLSKLENGVLDQNLKQLKTHLENTAVPTLDPSEGALKAGETS